MLNKFSTMLIYFMLALFSCKKENTVRNFNFQNHSPHLTYPFIKSVSSTYDPTFTYYYDTLGRLEGYGTNIYAYTVDSVYWNGQGWYALNSPGLVTSCVTNSNFIYSYDSSGRLVSVSAPEEVDSDFYQNNNLVASISRGDTESGQVKYDVTFFYYNSHISTLGNYNYGLPYLGKSSVNLPDSVIGVESYGPLGLSISVFYNAPQNDIINRTTYTYTFNSLGYVESCTSVYTILQDGPPYTTISTSNFIYY
jgi:hypothetical protein